MYEGISFSYLNRCLYVGIRNSYMRLMFCLFWYLRSVLVVSKMYVGWYLEDTEY